MLRLVKMSDWIDTANLPSDVSITKLDTLSVPRVGRTGSAVYNLIQLDSVSGKIQCLVEYRTRLLARDVPKLKAQALDVISQVIARRKTSELSVSIVPALATDSAQPSVKTACERDGVALFDERGTTIVRGGPFMIHIEGKSQVHRRYSVQSFAGKGARIVRVLLGRPSERFSPKQLATRTETSAGYVYGVLTQLEQEGFVARHSPRSGYFLKDPIGLLRAWIENGSPTALRVERFYAPDTTHAALRLGADALQAAGIRSVFGLASALLPEEQHVSAIPHGIYTTGGYEPLVSALKLKQTTPHNFLVLIPEALSTSENGGIFFDARTLPWGQGVSIPQLIVDFARLGGRGIQQSEYLLEAFGKQLPYSEVGA